MIKSLCIFCGSSVGKDLRYREAGIAMGEYLAKNDITLVYGGGRIGLMGIIANTVLENGGKVVGVIPGFLSTEEIKHDGLTECFEVSTMHERKLKMYELSDAFLVMPGGFGTLDEFFEILTWHQLGLHNKSIGIYNVEGYFNSLIQMIQNMQSERFIPQEFNDNLKFFGTLSEVGGWMEGMKNEE